MKVFVVFAALVCACAAKPGVLSLVPGAPIGLDGRVVDTPEVAHAKAEHAAAHHNEKLRNLEHVAPVAPVFAAAPVAHAAHIAHVAPVVHAAPVAHSAQYVQHVPVAAAPVVSYASAPIVSVVPGSPIGLDGRVVDTAEVALAKAQHAAAHVNEKINLHNEAVKSVDVLIAAPYHH